MTFTNNENLPAPLFKAICNDSYDAGESDISVTALVGPARIRSLKKRHGDKLTEDASERIWSLIGQVGHLILERATDSGMSEHRLYITRRALRIGGQMDLLNMETLTDYKVCSFHVAKDGPKKEWIEQLNIYRLIARENQINITQIQVVAIFRDWSKLAAARQQNGDYPQAQVKVMPIPLWPYDKIEAYLDSRITAHLGAEKELPLCSDEERWMRPESWAVVKKGAKRATKLHPTEQEAETHASQIGARVEHRPGENIRCEHYCPVSAYCVQFRELMQA